VRKYLDEYDDSDEQGAVIDRPNRARVASRYHQAAGPKPPVLLTIAILGFLFLYVCLH